jgi:hypothetical protein
VTLAEHLAYEQRIRRMQATIDKLNAKLLHLSDPDQGPIREAWRQGYDAGHKAATRRPGQAGRGDNGRYIQAA